MARALLLAVAIMCGCQRPPTSPESASEAVRWIHDCAYRQIGDARAWYEGLSGECTNERLEVEVQSLLATLGKMKTCRLVHDSQGVPVDVVLDEGYWGRAGEVMAAESLESWRMWAQSILDDVLVATGARAPISWEAAEALPVVRSVSSEGDGVAVLRDRIGLESPTTLQLRALVPLFPDTKLFPLPPKSKEDGGIS